MDLAAGLVPVDEPGLMEWAPPAAQGAAAGGEGRGEGRGGNGEREEQLGVRRRAMAGKGA